MTEKLYYSDGYLRETDAVVTAIDGDAVILDRSIFYPEAGGQPGDRGMIGSFIVSDTKKGTDGTPLHIVKGEKPEIGKSYHIALDWEHRYFYMTEHSAQHLVSALLHSMYGIGTAAVHQGEEFFTIETDRDEIDTSVLLSVEDAASDAIRAGHRIYQLSMSHGEAEALHMRRSIKVQGDVLVVFIEGLDAVACGGVHLRSTSEIREITFCGSERIRGHVRTIWKCSSLSVAERRRNASIVSSLSALLSSEPEKIVESAGRLAEEYAELRREVRTLSARIAEYAYMAARERTQKGKAVIFIADTDISAFEGAVPEDEEQSVLVLSGNRFLFHGTEERFALLRKGLSSFSIRGGGRGVMFRGSFAGDASVVAEEAGKILNDQPAQ